MPGSSCAAKYCTSITAAWECKPQHAQVGPAKRLLSSATGSLALLLGTGTETQLSAGAQSFLQSFSVSFCFQPIALKAFVFQTEGVVLKEGPDAPWLILKKQMLGGFKPIGRMSSRPSSADIENAFLNAAAVDSPVNRGINAVRRRLPF